MARYRLQKAEAEECAGFSWFNVLFHVFMMRLSRPSALGDVN